MGEYVFLTGQSQSNDTCTLCSSWGCCSTSGGRKDKAQKSLKKSRLRWGSGAQNTKSKRTSGVHMSQVVGNVIGPVLCVPHHVLHVPPDGSPWGWHGEHKESWNKKQTLHDETLSVAPTHLLLDETLTRDWNFGRAAERYDSRCRCSENADV